MRCQICKGEKLSKEFIFDDLSSSCKHPRLICLRCACESAKSGICPYKNCDSPVNEDALQEFKVAIECLFSEIEENVDDAVENESNTFNIVMLTGKRQTVMFESSMTILHLRELIEDELKVQIKKQRLLYHDKEMTDHIRHKKATLADFDIMPNSTVVLILVLFTIPDNLDHVKFDLFWEFPLDVADFIDATCLLYQNTSPVGVVHHKDKQYESAVVHSGDDLDMDSMLCTQTIDVHLKKVPQKITHLFFAISAYDSPTISKFPNPSLRFYEASNPNVDLCTTTFSHEINSQALIMCSVVRKDSSWEIWESGKESSGNNRDYTELKQTIESLIRGNMDEL